MAKNMRGKESTFKTKIAPALLAMAIVAGIVSLLGTESGKRQSEILPEFAAKKDNQEPTTTTPIDDYNTAPQPTEPAEDTNKLYTWKDKNGVINFSNTEAPSSNHNVIVKELRAHDTRVTPVTINGNQILVPVILGNNGKTIEVTLMLDTGCTGFFIHHDVATALNPRRINSGKTTIANGQEVPTDFCTVDFVQIGPFVERNFEISTHYVHNIEKQNFQGLLGMGFLKKHPFQIDMEKKVIRWM